MTSEEMTVHGKKYSKSYGNEYGQWKQNPHVMGMKTVVKLLLSKFGILSISMETAIQADQAVIHEDGSYEYIDNPNKREHAKEVEVMERFGESSKGKTDDFESSNEGSSPSSPTKDDSTCTTKPISCGKSINLDDKGKFTCADTKKVCPY